MSVDVGSAKGYLDLDISGFLSGLKTAQDEADKSSKNIATKIGTNIQGIGKSLTSAGSTLTKTVTVPLMGIGAAGLKVASDFEKGMSQVQAISGATGKDFDALKDKAIELGASTAFSAGEVAEAMTEMAKAGWSSQQIIDGMGGVLSAAAASGEGLGVVSTIVADAITGFGLAASDSSKVADLLTQAANSGTIGITDLGESFKYIAPVASAMGISVEDATTAISAMSMAGIKGSQAGTALRTMLTRMIKPNEETAKAMAILGVEVKNADGSMKSLNDIVSSLRAGFDNLTESEKAKYAATIAGQEGMAGMLSLLNLTEEEYNAISDSMNNASGVAEKTASVMQNNLSSKTEQMIGALESLAIKLSDAVIPHIQEFVVWLTELIEKFTDLDPETQKTILKLAGIVAAIGPVLFVIGKLTTGIGGLVTTFGNAYTAFTKFGEGFKLAKAGFPALGAEASKFGAMLGGVIGPLLAIVAVIAVVVAAFTTLWKNNEEFRNKVIAIWDQVKATFEKLTSGIVERLNKLGFDFSSIGEVLKAIWEGFCNFLAPIFEGVFQYIADTFDFIVNYILGLLDFFIALFTGDWEGAWNAIKNMFIDTWNYIKDFFVNIWNMLIGILDAMCGWFGTTWENVWTSIKDFFVNIWNSIVTFFVGLWDGIVGIVQTAWNWITEILSVAATWVYDNVIAPIAQFFTDLWTGIVDTWHMIIDPWIEILRRLGVLIYDEVIVPVGQFFTDLWNGIVAGLQAAWDWIVNLLATVANWINTNVIQPVATFFKNMWNGITNAASACWNGIVSVWKVVSTWFNDKIVKPLGNLFTSAWDGLKNGAKNAWEGVKSVFSTVTTWFKNIFKKAWEGVVSVFSPLGDVFVSIKEGVVSVFKSVVNGLIDGINWVISQPFEGLNNILETLYNLEILGVKPFEWLTWRAPIPQIPYLAKGAVLNPNNPFLAVVGDQKQGVNVEAPLTTIQEAVARVIKSFAYDIISLQQAAYSVLSGCYDELGYISYHGFKKPIDSQNQNKSRTKDNVGGDTYNFYSPKPIDEIEAAKQIKRTKRDLAEGF